VTFPTNPPAPAPHGPSLNSLLKGEGSPTGRQASHWRGRGFRTPTERPRELYIDANPRIGPIRPRSSLAAGTPLSENNLAQPVGQHCAKLAGVRQHVGHSDKPIRAACSRGLGRQKGADWIFLRHCSALARPPPSGNGHGFVSKPSQSFQRQKIPSHRPPPGSSHLLFERSRPEMIQSVGSKQGLLLKTFHRGFSRNPPLRQTQARGSGGRFLPPAMPISFFGNPHMEWRGAGAPRMDP